MNALRQTFPGQRIYVPIVSVTAMRRFRDNFEPLIGVRAILGLFEVFGGGRFTVPSLNSNPRLGGFPPVSIKMVAKLTAKNLSAYQIALKMGCDPRTVHKAREKARKRGLLPNPSRKELT